MAGFASTLKLVYLSVYNWAVFLGWARVLYFAITAPLEFGHEAVYGAVKKPLQLAQTAAVMEILHGLIDWIAARRYVGDLVELPRD